MDTVLDHSAMVQAASLLSGTHNFSWLSVIEPGDEMDPIRNVNLVVDCLEGNRHTTTAFWNAAAAAAAAASFSSQETAEQNDTLSPILFRISATTDFFLYKMTRRIVGALVAIGSGKVKISDLEDCIVRHDDHDAGREEEEKKKKKHPMNSSSIIPHGLLQTAPACGLCLDHVEYNITI
jgi:tRNA U38,U39,U40 pseudouridine synthase TruA